MPLPNLEKLRVKRCGEVREAILSYELIMHLVPRAHHADGYRVTEDQIAVDQTEFCFVLN